MNKSYVSIYNISGFEITMKNHCYGDIFEHSFRLKPETMLIYISVTVIFLHYFKPIQFVKLRSYQVVQTVLKALLNEFVWYMITS